MGIPDLHFDTATRVIFTEPIMTATMNGSRPAPKKKPKKKRGRKVKLGGWDWMGQSARSRRAKLMRSRPKHMSLKSKYLSCIRSLRSLIRIAKTPATVWYAKRDTEYFMKKHYEA